jgi:hypothetical protein
MFIYCNCNCVQTAKIYYSLTSYVIGKNRSREGDVKLNPFPHPKKNFKKLVTKIAMKHKN